MGSDMKNNLFDMDQNIPDVLSRLAVSYRDWEQTTRDQAIIDATLRIDELTGNTQKPYEQIEEPAKPGYVLKTDITRFALDQMDILRGQQEAIAAAMVRPDNKLTELENLYAEQRELNGFQRALRTVLEHFQANHTVPGVRSRQLVNMAVNHESTPPSPFK